jgi:hypothetical protein
LFALPSLAVAHLARRGPRRASDALRWLVPFAALALAVVVFYPYLVDFERWARLKDDKLQVGGHNFVWNKFDGSGFERLFGGLYHYDPALVACGAFGLVVALIALGDFRLEQSERASERRRELAVVGAFALSYALVFGAYGGSFDRFVTPLIPVIAIFAALGVRAIARIATPRAAERRRRAIAVAIALAALAVPTWASIRLVSLRAQPDTLEVVSQWLDKKLDPANDRIWVNYGVDLPLSYSRASLEHDRGVADQMLRFFWLRHQIERNSPLARSFDVFVLPDAQDPFWVALQKDPERALASLGDGYVLCARFPEDVYTTRTTTLRNALQRFGRRAVNLRASFDPASTSPGFQYDSLRFFDDLRRASSVGPGVEVFELGRNARRRE